MKELTIISGKGGTGKTSISASFAVLARNHVMADCDVDAANLHLLLSPTIEESGDFPGMPQARINREKCTGCGICENLCRYGAIHEMHVNETFCEGCGVCYHACPAGAVELVENISGQWYISRTRFGPFVHARLNIAGDNSGLLVAEVRRRARKLAESDRRKLIITDGPPGIGCPVISALSGSDLALMVAEPTLSSIHDLTRVLKLADHFNVKTAVCVNKWDINPSNTREIETLCWGMGVPVIGKIGYDISFMAAAIERKPVVQVISAVVDDVVSLWDCVQEELGI